MVFPFQEACSLHHFDQEAFMTYPRIMEAARYQESLANPTRRVGA